MPLAHVSLPISSTPLEEARDFYLKALAPLGYGIFQEYGCTDKPGIQKVGMKTAFGPPDFWLHFREEDVKRNDLGMPIYRTPGRVQEKRGVHVAFVAGSRKVVREFWDAARKAGATDNGKPGERSYTKGYYAAYVLDFEGNNIECVYYQPWWLSVIQLAPLTLGGILLGCMAWYAGRAGWSL